MWKIPPIRFLLLVFVAYTAQAHRRTDNLRQRMHLMENILRDDINVVRETLNTETEEREAFEKSVTAFIELINNTLLQNNLNIGDNTVTFYDLHFRVLRLQTGFSSIKKVSKFTSKTVDHILEEIESLSDSISDMKGTLSRIDETCSMVYTSLCSCQGWKKKHLQCYQIFNETKSWLDARDYCQSLNGHLAVIPNQEINDFLADSTTELQYFIDGTDSEHEGEWVWSLTGKAIEFSNWINGQPDNYYGREHCLTLRRKGYEFRWNDMPCDMQLPFICQKPCKLQ